MNEFFRSSWAGSWLESARQRPLCSAPPQGLLGVRNENVQAPKGRKGGNVEVAGGRLVADPAPCAEVQQTARAPEMGSHQRRGRLLGQLCAVVHLEGLGGGEDPGHLPAEGSTTIPTPTAATAGTPLQWCKAAPRECAGMGARLFRLPESPSATFRKSWRCPERSPQMHQGQGVAS